MPACRIYSVESDGPVVAAPVNIDGLPDNHVIYYKFMIDGQLA